MIPTVETISKGGSRVWELSGSDLTIEQSSVQGHSGPFKLLLQVRGKTEILQAGRRTVLNAEEFSFVDGARPFRVATAGTFEQILVTLPRSLIVSLYRGIERRTAVGHGGDGSAGLIRDFLVAYASSEASLSEKGHAYATSALVQLVGGLKDSSGSDSRETLLHRAILLIDMNIADADPEAIAGRLGISRRYLDLVFSRAGRTFSEELWERRLATAADRLQRFDTLSITEVAHAVGFKDSSHFSRSFRRRYGKPPGIWRRSMRHSDGISGQNRQ